MSVSPKKNIYIYIMGVSRKNIQVEVGNNFLGDPFGKDQKA